MINNNEKDVIILRKMIMVKSADLNKGEELDKMSQFIFSVNEF